jgi:hypothetical protein
MRLLALFWETLLTLASRHHILLSMALIQSQPPPCPSGQPLKVKSHRTCRAGKALTLSAQVLETMSIMPSRARRVQIIVDSVSPIRFNTLLSIPRCLKPTTWAPSFLVKGRQRLSRACPLLHKLQGYRLKVHFRCSKHLPWSRVHRVPASPGRTNACAQKAAKRSGRP